ncbi:MAG: hypothetical protein J0I32_05200 [Sphingobacteriales bacterium]|nr:hypothetical protein [Sphingobacteriales bacterium]OJW04023.1 MAG: hypothetical protein BGO52_17955 [Sphingobacteriales bacterium 44-61]
METGNNKLNKEEKENVLLVLNEFSEEYKANTKVIAALLATVKESSIKINEHLEKKKDEPESIAAIQQVEKLDKKLEELKRIIHAQPREIKQEKRILLFPEHGAKEYYGTILRWVLYIIIATYGFLLLKYIIDVMK